MSHSQVGQQQGKGRGRASKLIFRVLIASQISGMLLAGTLQTKFVSNFVIVSYAGYIFGLFAREFKPSAESASKVPTKASPAQLRLTITLLAVGLLCSVLGFLIVILMPMIMAYTFPKDPSLAGLPVVLFWYGLAGLLTIIGLVLSIIVGYSAISWHYPDSVARVGRIAPFASFALSVAPLLMHLL